LVQRVHLVGVIIHRPGTHSSVIHFPGVDIHLPGVDIHFPGDGIHLPHVGIHSWYRGIIFLVLVSSSR